MSSPPEEPELYPGKWIMETDCAVCGNERGADGPICRFCGAGQEPAAGKNIGFRHKTVNLEHGRPFVAAAIRKLLCEIQSARIERVRVLTVIHGYGSSGRGGTIRSECRKSLDYLLSTGEIKGYISGEDFSSSLGLVKTLLRQFPALTNNRNLDRRNPGVTLVIIQ